jgi:hypothetical protein
MNLPSGVLGPVDLSALMRLAAICLSVAMIYVLKKKNAAGESRACRD